MTEKTAESPAVLEKLRAVLFCLNLGFAAALLVTLSFASRPIRFVHGIPESPDLFHRILFKIDVLFGKAPWDTFAATVAVVGLSLVFCVTFLALAYLLSPMFQINRSLNVIIGVFALGAVPLCWIPYHPRVGTYSITGLGKIWYGIALEFAVVLGALYLTRKSTRALWFAIISVHYALWGWMLLKVTWSPSGVLIAVFWPAALSIVAPMSALVWAHYSLKPAGQTQDNAEDKHVQRSQRT